MHATGMAAIGTRSAPLAGDIDRELARPGEAIPNRPHGANMRGDGTTAGMADSLPADRGKDSVLADRGLEKAMSLGPLARCSTCQEGLLAATPRWGI